MATAPPTNPVTDRHVEQFHKYVRKWQVKLGLLDWRIVPSAKRSRWMAEVDAKLTDRMARYRIGTDFGQAQVTPHSLEATALHELLHVLLKELVEHARNDYCAEDIMSAEHRVINTLEKLLLPGDAT